MSTARRPDAFGGTRTALITGATSGIGYGFARRLAADGHDIVLVSREQERLRRVADELRAAHGRAVQVLPADLATATGRAAVADRLADPERPVELLVNNAGFVIGGQFLDSELADENALLAVHVAAVLELTHAAARAMTGRGRGGIINVSSVAGFVPRGTYAAAKAWVITFSRSLHAECRPHGVRVLVTCPGFTRTELHQRGGFRRPRLPSWLWLEPDTVVDAALRDLAAGRALSVPGTPWKVITAAARHLPVGPVVRRTRSAGRRPHRAGDRS